MKDHYSKVKAVKTSELTYSERQLSNTLPKLNELEEEQTIITSLAELAKTAHQKKYLMQQLKQNQRQISIKSKEVAEFKIEAVWERQIFLPLKETIEVFHQDMVSNPLDKSRVKNLEKLLDLCQQIYTLQNKPGLPTSEAFKTLVKVQKLKSRVSEPHQQSPTSFEYPFGIDRENVAIEQWAAGAGVLQGCLVEVDEIQNSEFWTWVNILEDTVEHAQASFQLLRGDPSSLQKAFENIHTHSSRGLEKQIATCMQENKYKKDPTWKARQQLQKATVTVQSSRKTHRL